MPLTEIVIYGRAGVTMRIGMGAFIAPFIFNVVIG